MRFSQTALAFVFLLIAPAASNSVHHVELKRNPVPVSRAFVHANRPWARKIIDNADPKLHQVYARSMKPRVRLGGSINGSLPFEQLYGGITTVGEYYVELKFGGQPVRVQVDTGSSTLAVPLSDCVNCRRNDQRFNLRRAVGSASVIRCDSSACMRNTCGIFPECNVCSASNRACCSRTAPANCGFFLRYADNSGAQGALVEAEVSLAGFKAPIIFGGILRQIRDFESSEVDGIFGMAYKSLACNPTCVEPLFDTLVDTGKVARDKFSLCTGAVGGTLTLGGNNPEQYEGDLQYVPMGNQKLFYDVDINAFEVGGERLSLPTFSNGIVDSGTTVLVTTTKAYQTLKTHFQSKYCDVPLLCPQSQDQYRASAARMIRLNNTRNRFYEDEIEDDGTWFSPAACVSLPQEYVDMLPSLTLVLEGGVRLSVDPDEYMLKVEVQDSWWLGPHTYRCLGIQPLPGMERLPNNVIIGDTVLQKYYYEIDREKNRVGFAKSKNCQLSKETIAELRKQAATTIIPSMPGGSIWRWVLGVTAVSALVLLLLIARGKRSEYAQIS